MYVRATKEAIEGWSGVLVQKTQYRNILVACLKGKVNFYLPDELWFDLRTPECSIHLARLLGKSDGLDVSGGVTFGVVRSDRVLTDRYLLVGNFKCAGSLWRLPEPTEDRLEALAQIVEERLGCQRMSI